MTACRPELVEVSLEPQMVRAATFRCGACGNAFTLRTEPMLFPTMSLPEEQEAPASAGAGGIPTPLSGTGQAPSEG